MIKTIELAFFVLLLQSELQTAYPTKRKDLREVAIINQDQTKGLILGDSRDKAETILGYPDLVISDPGRKGITYFYNKSRLSFIRNILVSYEIVDDAIMVGEIHGRTFKIGDQLITPEIRRRGDNPYSQDRFMDFGLLRVEEEQGGNMRKYIVFGARLKKMMRLLDSSIILKFDENRRLINVKIVLSET